MRSASQVSVALIGKRPGVRAQLKISLLPRSLTDPAPLIDCLDDGDRDRSVSPIQLLETHEYRYEWHVDPPLAVVATDPEEIFYPDSGDGLQGRLRPGLATGLLRVVLRADDEVLGELELEVRSRKLLYRSEYRWMLRDIADQMTELLMQRFASSAAFFRQDSTRDAVTLYQRFEFLRSLLTSEVMDRALKEIARRPHVAWEEQRDFVKPGQTLRASGQTVRLMSRPGNRVPWPDGTLPFIPVRIESSRTDATTDTTPNRFVRFAFERWRQVITDLQNALQMQVTSPSLRRAEREIAQTLELLDGVLRSDSLKDVGSLMHFPADSQVLHRREGYRDIFRAYVEFELAAKLSWRNEENAYSAGQRDVAQLYEYWAFLQLAKLISQSAGASFDISSVLQAGKDGITIGLRSGDQTVVSGIVSRGGRRLALEFCFNRTFSRKDSTAGSWAMPMRPDYSLIISAAEEEAATFEPVVLHFDAKYRVSHLRELFGSTVSNKDDVRDGDELSRAPLRRDGPKRDDLLKMHAYRDAIRRSAGAYVIYPGDDDKEMCTAYPEYQELLPGLGAFVLRPSSEGSAAGAAVLHGFIEEVLEHVAARLTRHERGRYWLRETYTPYEIGTRGWTGSAVVSPSDDTSVLLGYVKSVEHWQWIQKRMTYNVRVSGRRGGVEPNAELLYSQLLLLYGPSIDIVALARIVSGPELVSRAEIVATGYPSPNSDYLCVQLSWVSQRLLLVGMEADAIDRFVVQRGQIRGQPTSVRWGGLAAIRMLVIGDSRRREGKSEL